MKGDDHVTESPRQEAYVVLTELFLPTKGGTAVWFDEVYRRIGDRSTHVITAAVADSSAHDEAHQNTIHRLNLARSNWMRPASLPLYLKFFAMTLYLGLRYRFHQIHAGRVLPEGLIAVVCGRLLRIPSVVYAHGEELTTWRRSKRRLRAMRFAFGLADTAIANSEFTKSHLLELGIAPEKIRLIYPGVDVARFHPMADAREIAASLGIRPEQKFVLSVGRLSRRKGFDKTIEAVAALRRTGLDVEYVIIGIGEDEGYLNELAQSAGIEQVVHLIGHVPADDLPKWYNACDVFAMPNREIDGDTEGFGMVFIEAAACCKPSVAGDAGGTGDAVVDGVTGLRVAAEFDWNVVAEKTMALSRKAGGARQ